MTYSFRATAILLITVLFGCATTAIDQPPDSMEAVFRAPEDQVKTALLEVLTADGYPIRRDQGQVINTGYREEINSIWDRLLVYRFGVGRSRVDATVTSDDPTETRVSVQVTFESKRYLWSSWREATPPLQQSAANQLRRIKQTLGLL